MDLIEALDQRDVGSMSGILKARINMTARWRGGRMDLVETLEKLTETTKELLDLCKEQAEIIEALDLVSVDDALETRGLLTKSEQVLGKYGMSRELTG